MKQEILCMDCKPGVRALFKTDTPYAGEHVKFVDGKALRPFVCDHCNASIIINQYCCAHTIWADHGAQPYYEWEPEFIKIT